MPQPTQRIAIIGAGPIGLEAAVFARRRGFDVTVLERGYVAENVQRWGHVRLFSPFGMNSSEWGRELLGEAQLPKLDTILTGFEFADRYLIPLSEHDLLKGCVREFVAVQAIGRRDLWKGDLIGKSARSESPFQLLVMSVESEKESLIAADVVLDCSGTYGQHNWLGAGGVPCLGERRHVDPSDYSLPEIGGRQRPQFGNRRTLVVGSGFSAATAIVALGKLAAEDSGVSALWVTRSNSSPPISPIADDPLPERAALTEQANRLATGRSSSIQWQPSTVVRGIKRGKSGRLRVTLDTKGQGGRVEVVDQILALVGYRPDRSIYEELQVHECYASQGPIKLAAALLGETSGDCTQQRCYGAETLKNPEPGFFILGAKSYGRDSRFLLRVGIEQVAAVFSMI